MPIEPMPRPPKTDWFGIIMNVLTAILAVWIIFNVYAAS